MAFSRYFDNSQLAEAIRIANGQTKGKFASTGDPVHYDYHVPIKFEEKTDIEIKAENQAASGSISALFDLILVDDF